MPRPIQNASIKKNYTLQITIFVLLGLAALFPFLLTPSLNITTLNGGSLTKTTKGMNERQQLNPRKQRHSWGGPAPRRYFATTTGELKYYPEPTDGTYASIPSREWDEQTLSPIDYWSSEANISIRETMDKRLSALLESDAHGGRQFLPPQFPQWDRSLHKLIARDSTILGMPPECCPNNDAYRMLTNGKVLSEEELQDCECRSPRNYPSNNRSMATLVTAFYQMSSKHPVKMYQKTSGQLLATSDPMIIFCEPKTDWVDFFIERRKHAPTIIVPLPSEEFRLIRQFPQETFWKKQYEIDPEAPTHHKNVNTMLYVIWDEKLVLLHTAAMLNPFNTTQFVWVDTGYWRNPAPHLYRNSAVRINLTERGVSDDSTLLFQMIPYDFNRDTVISGDQVLVGGNCFAGTYTGVSHLYSAFYDTFWAMASTGKFVGSDQKVLYRACHTYPSACHIHVPRKMRQWLLMLGELLPDIGREKIGDPLKLQEFVPPNEKIHAPHLVL